MLYLIQFRDNPDMRHLRPQLMEAHLGFLRAQGDKLRTAGSLRHESDDRALGGMWIVDVNNFEEVTALYQADPFWTAGLRASVEICRYAKAFPDVEKTV
ncbi:MAG: YciI family protein [Opitutaceae bacterium]